MVIVCFENSGSICYICDPAVQEETAKRMERMEACDGNVEVIAISEMQHVSVNVCFVSTEQNTQSPTVTFADPATEGNESLLFYW
jgi:hypothetical protein